MTERQTQTTEPDAVKARLQMAEAEIIHLRAENIHLRVSLAEAAGFPRLYDALEQALDCLNDETPEDCTREEAKADTIQKIREALNGK